ncbi:MAG: RecQ family ATP-dependent DNA helicase [Robiginitalea sp.]
MERFWGYPDFRGSQEKIINEVTKGKDVITLMPTGGGKSLCYQIPAMLHPGICIVISPLLALMEDQVSHLNARGIRALSLSGKMQREDVSRLLDNVEYGKFKFLYLSPERLQQEHVLERIKRLPVNLIAIDEAHCISQWGFDFRPSYLKCIVLRQLHPDIPLIALTATGTAEVLSDIETCLNLQSPSVFRDSVYRANIFYSVSESEDKNYRLNRLLTKDPGSAIVYVSTRKATVIVSRYLSSHTVTAAPYHGGLPSELKSQRLKDWQSGKTRVMVATNAFGMGIDKADVRLVVHYDIPETIENYFQEAGRAGRDGEPAKAALILSPGDLQKAREHYLGNLPTVEDLLITYQKLNSYFKIPYGELVEETYPFKFTDFCHTYSLPVNITYNALEILDRQGVISLSQQFWQKTRIRFICTKTTLWDYLRTYPRLQSTAQILLRTYGGLFDFETQVNLASVARKSGNTESTILHHLKQLQKDEIIHLEMTDGDLEIRFLLPREDEKTIYAFSNEVTRRLEIKKQKVAEMAAYLQNNGKCRQLQLLAYFGEEGGEPCGNCDVCLPSEGLKEVSQESIKARILASLNTGPKTSRQLLEEGGLPEIQTLSCLEKLLHEGTLTLGVENEYRIA